MTWLTRCAAVCAIRRALDVVQKPRRLQLNATLVVAAIATAQAQETVDQDAASRKVSNSSLTDCGAGSGFGWLLIKEDRFLVAITRTQGLGCFDFASVFVRFAARADEALSVYKHNFDIGAMALLPPAQT